MIKLEEIKIWHGDGFVSNPVTLTQMKRSETIALYQRTKFSGTFDGYELFIIKFRHKGDPLPGNTVEKEDREVYPAAGSFGKTAWHIWSLPFAEKKYDELVAKGIANESGIEFSKKELTIPIGDFSTNELVSLNSISYPLASLFIKDSVKNGLIKFVKEERRNTRGKMTKLYSKL